MSEPDRAIFLLDGALVVRGGQNLPENFAQGSGVAVGDNDQIEGVSVNSAAQWSVDELTASNSTTGYPGIPHRRVGTTTVGAVREAGGDVVASPTWANPAHATLSGITPERASELFQPTIRNPSRSPPTSEHS